LSATVPRKSARTVPRIPRATLRVLASARLYVSSSNPPTRVSNIQSKSDMRSASEVEWSPSGRRSGIATGVRSAATTHPSTRGSIVEAGAGSAGAWSRVTWGSALDIATAA
jgi:hypothetical protein